MRLRQHTPFMIPCSGCFGVVQRNWIFLICRHVSLKRLHSASERGMGWSLLSGYTFTISFWEENKIVAIRQRIIWIRIRKPHPVSRMPNRLITIGRSITLKIYWFRWFCNFHFLLGSALINRTIVGVRSTSPLPADMKFFSTRKLNLHAGRDWIGEWPATQARWYN